MDNTFIEMSSTRVIIETKVGSSVIMPNDCFALKEHHGVPYLNLKDISERITNRYGDELVIYVWEELGLSGRIYKYVAYDSNDWQLHGKTNGFA